MSQSDASQLAARHRELRIETYLLVASPLLLFSLSHPPYTFRLPSFGPSEAPISSANCLLFSVPPRASRHEYRHDSRLSCRAARFRADRPAIPLYLFRRLLGEKIMASVDRCIDRVLQPQGERKSTLALLQELHPHLRRQDQPAQACDPGFERCYTMQR